VDSYRGRQAQVLSIDFPEFLSLFSSQALYMEWVRLAGEALEGGGDQLGEAAALGRGGLCLMAIFRCVCVCVCARERERERVCVCSNLFLEFCDMGKNTNPLLLQIVSHRTSAT
jgi:hypothetical protein